MRFFERRERCCAIENGNQCRATKDLTNVQVTTKQGTILLVPEKVVVKLCPKHFQLNIKVEVEPSRSSIEEWY